MEKQAAQRRGGYLEAMLNSCPLAILAVNAEGKITFASKEACMLTEREMKELIGESIEIVYEDLEAARETNRKLYMSAGVIHDHESKVKTKSGRIIPVRISASHLKDVSGNYTGAVGYFEKYRPWKAEEVNLKCYSEQLEAELSEWKDLGAPIFELYPGLSSVVIVGRLSMSRFERISLNLLDHIKNKGSRVALIDLSAALINDEKVAAQLVKTIRTISLIGAECVLAGVQSSVAQDMEPVVSDINAIKSFSSISLALEAAIDMIELKICKKH